VDDAGAGGRGPDAGCRATTTQSEPSVRYPAPGTRNPAPGTLCTNRKKSIRHSLRLLDDAGTGISREDEVMPKCKNCGMELGPEQSCVFATYKVESGGKELLICCERCAGHAGEAPPPEAAPEHPVAEMMPATPPQPARKEPLPVTVAPRKIVAGLVRQAAATAVRRVARRVVKRAARKAVIKSARKAVKRAVLKAVKKAAKKGVKRAAGKAVKRAARKVVKKTARKAQKKVAPRKRGK
jgi:hypothetical protein